MAVIYIVGNIIYILATISSGALDEAGASIIILALLGVGIYWLPKLFKSEEKPRTTYPCYDEFVPQKSKAEKLWGCLKLIGVVIGFFTVIGVATSSHELNMGIGVLWVILICCVMGVVIYNGFKGN